jgi:hypothetical protein
MSTVDAVFGRNDSGTYGSNSNMVANQQFIDNGYSAAARWALEGMRQVRRQRKLHDSRTFDGNSKADIFGTWTTNEKLLLLVPVGAYKEGHQGTLAYHQALWVFKTPNDATGEHLPANLPLLNMFLEEAAIWEKSRTLLEASGLSPFDAEEDDGSVWGMKQARGLTEAERNLATTINAKSKSRRQLYALPNPGQSKAAAVFETWRMMGCITGFMIESEEYQKNPNERLVSVAVGGREWTNNVFSPVVQVGDVLWFIVKEIANKQAALLGPKGQPIGQRTRDPTSFLQIQGMNSGANGTPYYFSAPSYDDEPRRGDLRYIEKDVRIFRSKARYVHTATGEPLTDAQRKQLPPHLWTLKNSYNDPNLEYDGPTEEHGGRFFLYDIPRCGARYLAGKVLHVKEGKTTYHDIDLAIRDVKRYATQPLIELDVCR